MVVIGHDNGAFVAYNMAARTPLPGGADKCCCSHVAAALGHGLTASCCYDDQLEAPIDQGAHWLLAFVKAPSCNVADD